MRAATTCALMLWALATGCAFDGPGGISGDGDIGDGDGDIGDGDGDGDGDVGPDAMPGPDEDGDGVSDEDDNCPGIANADQKNVGEINNGKAADGVGDACDPRPDQPGDRILVFDPLDGPLSPEWATTTGTWTMTSEGLAQTDNTAISPTAYRLDIDLEKVAIETRVRVDSLGATSDIRGVGLVGHYSDSNGEDGYACFDYENTTFQKDYGLFEFVQSGATRRVGVTPFPAIEVSSEFVYTMKVTGDTSLIACGRQMPEVVISTFDTSTQRGSVGIRAHRAAATYFYVTIYALDESSVIGGEEGESD